MRTKFIAIICFILSATVIFQSCDKDEDTPQIGILLKSSTNDWRKALRYYAENRLNERNITYTFTGSQSDNTQGQMLRSMVEIKGCQVIIISPDGVTAEDIAVATNRNIPVIFLEETVGNNYTSLVKTDNYLVGEMAANYLNNINISDSIAILLTTQQDTIISDERASGCYFNLMSEKKLVQPVTNYSYSLGKAFGTHILDNYPRVEAIYAQDDEVALGFLEAIDEEENRNKKDRIKAIIGCGGSQLFLSQIINRKDSTTKLATTYYSPAMMEKCVDVAIDILNGNQVDQEYIYEPELIDINNAESYIDFYLPY